jgi:hypothetical protein
MSNITLAVLKEELTRGLEVLIIFYIFKFCFYLCLRFCLCPCLCLTLCECCSVSLLPCVDVSNIKLSVLEEEVTRGLRSFLSIFVSVSIFVAVSLLMAQMLLKTIAY